MEAEALSLDCACGCVSLAGKCLCPRAPSGERGWISSTGIKPAGSMNFIPSADFEVWGFAGPPVITNASPGFPTRRNPGGKVRCFVFDFERASFVFALVIHFHDPTKIAIAVRIRYFSIFREFSRVLKSGQNRGLKSTKTRLF